MIHNNLKGSYLPKESEKDGDEESERQDDLSFLFSAEARVSIIHVISSKHHVTPDIMTRTSTTSSLMTTCPSN